MNKFAITTFVASLVVASSSWANLLVTEVWGKVTVSGKGIVATLDEIPDGAQLKFAPGARLVAVDLANGKEYVVDKVGEYRVVSGGLTMQDGNQVSAVALPVKTGQQVRIAAEKVAPATIVMRGLVSPTRIQLIAPVDSVVLSVHPSLQWKGIEGANTYAVSVWTKTPKDVIWSASTSNTELAIPPELLLVPGETYGWQVETKTATGKSAKSSSKFSIATEATHTRLDKLRAGNDAPFARRVLYAVELDKAGVREEAKVQWQVLARERPEVEALQARAR